MNLLLDTNVIIDYMGGKKPFFDNAQRVVASGYFGDTTLWASAQSFKDAYYVLSHYVDSIRVQEGILKLLEIVHPVDLTGEDITAAARLTWDDMEDCLVAVAATKANADYIITRDHKGFERSMVPAATPGDWLRQIRGDTQVVYDAVNLN